MPKQTIDMGLIRKIPSLLADKEGCRDACKILFKDDFGKPMIVSDYQVKIIQAIFFKDPKRCCCTATTRAGKSLAVALGVILLGVFKNGEKIRLIAPTEQHTKILMGYVIRHILDSPICSSTLMLDTKQSTDRLKKELTKSKLTFKNDNEIITITANITGKGRSLVGWGGTAVVVDEAEQIPTDLMRTKVMRMLGDTADANIFLIGNPVSYGYMWEKSTDPNWTFFKVGWEECVQAGRMTKEFVKNREKEMTSNEFKVWYKGEWADTLEDQLFPQPELEMISAKITPEEKELLTMEPDEKRLGCDIARFGNDRTVLCKLERYDSKWFIVKFKVYRKKDTMKTVGEIVAWDREEHFGTINIDDAGLGGGVTDRLREIDGIKRRVFPFLAGELPCKFKRVLTKTEEEKNKQFFNKKSYWLRKLETLTREGRIRLVDEEYGDVLINDLRKLRYEFTSSGKLKTIDPEDKSPDFADAVNIGLFNPHKLVFDFV